MKKIILAVLVALAITLSGCAKGEITLDISRWGAADVSCKLITAPLLKGVLGSFQDEFKQDGYVITDVQDGDMSGFKAFKHYKNVGDIKDSKVLEAFRFDKLKQAVDTNKEKDTQDKNKKEDMPIAPAPAPTPTDTAPKSMVNIKQGLLFDTISVKTGLNLNPSANMSSPEVKFMLDNVFKQMELKFILKLPTATDSNDASQVSDDGKTLTWNLALGGTTPINATVTYLNPVKAASWLAILVLICLGAFLYHNYKKHKKPEVVKDGTAK